MGALLKILPQVVTKLPAILGFLPMVVQLVKLAEQLLGGGGTGALKKELVVSLIKAAIKLAEQTSGKDLVENEAAIAEAIGEVVEAVVQVLKAVKVV